jgi:serine acetyltransferase
MGSENGSRGAAIELTAPELSFAQLVWSDYLASHLRRERPLRAALLFLPRLLVNPSQQLTLLIRIAQKGPRLVQYPVRLLQVILYSSEVYWFRREGSIEIGPGLRLPHPNNIVIGQGTRIGSDVTIYNCTNIGGNRHWEPGLDVPRAAWLGDRCVIYAYSCVQGDWRVGHDAVVGAHVVLDEDVPPGGLKTRKGLKLAGQWPGEQRLGADGPRLGV